MVLHITFFAIFRIDEILYRTVFIVATITKHHSLRIVRNNESGQNAATGLSVGTSGINFDMVILLKCNPRFSFLSRLPLFQQICFNFAT